MPTLTEKDTKKPPLKKVKYPKISTPGITPVHQNTKDTPVSLNQDQSIVEVDKDLLIVVPKDKPPAQYSLVCHDLDQEILGDQIPAKHLLTRQHPTQSLNTAKHQANLKSPSQLEEDLYGMVSQDHVQPKNTMLVSHQHLDKEYRSCHNPQSKFQTIFHTRLSPH